MGSYQTIRTPRRFHEIRWLYSLYTVFMKKNERGKIRMGYGKSASLCNNYGVEVNLAENIQYYKRKGGQNNETQRIRGKHYYEANFFVLTKLC